MTALFRKAIDIREGELKRTLVMAGYLFILIVIHSILKAMSRALFLSQLGPEELPYLYMMLAVVGGIVVVFYLRLSANVRLDRLINGTSVFLILNLVFFRYLIGLTSTSAWLYYSLYIWESLLGVVTTTQFWLIANYLFNAREAKRLFPLLTASAIMGGITGGYTSLIVDFIGGTPNLAFLCMSLLGVAMVLMNLAWRHRDQSIERSLRAYSHNESSASFTIIGEVIGLIRNSRHLKLLIGIVSFTFVVIQIADFQFNAYASENIKEVDKLTKFLGSWVSNLSIIALIFQVFFANRLIKRFGVVAAMVMLPITMLVSSAWILLSYGLSSILAVKIGDGAMRHSINKVGTELLFLPLPPEVKKKTKAFLDMFVEKFARGTGGFLLLIFYTWLGLSVAQLSFVSITLASIWLVLCGAAYREYVNSFRQALAKRRIDVEAISVSIKDEATINALIVSLASQNERQVNYALRLLESVDGVDLVPPLRPLLRHPSCEVRLLTVRLLQQRGDSDLLPEVEPLLHDQDEDVRREAVRFHAQHSKISTLEILGQWLNDEDVGLQGAALYHLAEKPELAAQLLSPQFIDSFMQRGAPSRRQVADALGILRDERYYPILRQLLDDADAVVKARAIRSAGQTRAREFVPLLLQNLGDRTFRKFAREALAGYGDDITETLARYLSDHSTSLEIRRELPRALSLIASQRSVEVLLGNLPKDDDILRYQMIKALNKLRARYPELNFDQRVDQALIDELKNYFRMLATLHVTADPAASNGRPGSALLKRALQERLDDHLERIFRLLGLRYPPQDIYNAFAATNSANRMIRANAIEFLDNILANDLKRVLLPVVEDLPVEQVLQQADGVFDVPINNRRQALEHLVANSDSWLRSCALYEIWRSGLAEEFWPLINRAKEAPDTLVQETATFVLRQYA